MPAATVTVRASGSSATTWSIGFKESRLWVLSAMLLKQWRVPRTLRLLCRLTNSRTCSSELAGYRRSVLYSRLPAQFFSLSGAAQVSRGGRAGAAISAEKSLRNDRLFMAGYAGVLPTGSPTLLFDSESGGHCTSVLGGDWLGSERWPAIGGLEGTWRV